MAMIRAAVAMLAHCATEFRHRQNYNVVHALAQVGVERRDARAELLQKVAELAARVSFVDVRVPATNVRERHFQSDLRLD